jgi:hypothetical protein
VIPGMASKALAAGGRFAPRSVLLPAARKAVGSGMLERATRPAPSRPPLTALRRRPRPAAGA